MQASAATAPRAERTGDDAVSVRQRRCQERRAQRPAERLREAQPCASGRRDVASFHTEV
jgi:hypothetical protein